MNKYFYVPVVARGIFYDEKNLLTVTGIVDETLENRELSRIEMLYGDKLKDLSTEQKEEVLSHYNSETSLMYKERQFPDKLILVSNENGLKELATERDFYCPNDSYLSCFEVTGESLVDVFMEVDYALLAETYFHVYDHKMINKKLRDKRLNKTINC